MNITINWKTLEELREIKKSHLIEDIISSDWYEIKDNEEDENEYIELLEQLPIDVLQQYLDEEITSDELYDEYINKL